MSGLTRVNQRSNAATPSPVLYPPSGPSSGRATPQYSESPYGGGMSSFGGPGTGLGIGGPGSGYTRTAQEVEGQNDERLDGLLGKVKMLKDVRDGNLELSGMNDAFSSTSDFLNGTLKRMTKMAKRQGGNWCWFMAFLGLVLWIFVFVWWIRR
ncbi:protein transport protein bet1 [Cryptotrichosporon argae]